METIKQRKFWVEHYNDEKYVAIRSKIKEAFKDLVFDELPHKYYLHGKEITCVSNVTHLFVPHFDENTMAQATFERNFDNPKSKYYQMTPKMIKESWKKISSDACALGTDRHLFAESLFYFTTGQLDLIPSEFKERIQTDENGETVFCAEKPKEIAAMNFYKDLPDCYIPILAETKVYDEDLNYSGTFDLLMYYDAELNGKTADKSGLLVLDWKGLPLDTDILTVDGWKKMGDLKVGDVVFDKNGKETKILHVSDVHYNPCYKITFDNNDEIICDADHRWEIFFQVSCNKKKKYQIMTARELSHYIANINRKHSYLIPKIDNTCSVTSNNRYELYIDPYVLGVWLGDGHSSCGMITNMYDVIFDEIHNRGFKLGKDVSQGGAGLAKSRTIFGLLTLLKKYNLVNNKHIPYEYLISNYDVKFQILQGLMDTDGYYNKNRGRYVISTTRKYQVDFSVKLLSSLGIKPTVIELYKKLNGKKILAYDVCFWTDAYPFLCRNIEIDKKPKTNKHDFRIIKKIEEVDVVATKCIEVDSPTHTYLCGKNLLVTHNTNKDLYKNFNEEKMLYPFQDLLNMSLNVYKLQLSLYMNCIEKIGFKVIDRKLMWLKDDGRYEKIELEQYVDRLVSYLKQHPIEI